MMSDKVVLRFLVLLLLSYHVVAASDVDVVFVATASSDAVGDAVGVAYFSGCCLCNCRSCLSRLLLLMLLLLLLLLLLFLFGCFVAIVDCVFIVVD